MIVVYSWDRAMIFKGWCMSHIVTTVGTGGRVVIPSEYRKELGIEPGDTVIVTLEDRMLRILTPQEGVRRAQALVRKYVPAGTRLVDELRAGRLEETRREAAREREDARRGALPEGDTSKRSVRIRKG